MPVNPGIDFQLAQEEYHKAQTTSEKIRALENMYAKCPKHKGAENLLQEIKSKISKLKEKQEKESAKKGGYSISIKKEGAASVCLLGITNSGKSTILNSLTNVNTKISEYEYTTKMPEVGVMDYHGIKIQIVEIPAVFPEFSEKGNGPTFLSIARNSDLIVIVLDGAKPSGEQLKMIEKECKNALIDLDGETKGSILGIPCLIVVTKEFKRPKTKHSVVKLDNLKFEIWKKLNLIYVFTKSPGKERDFPPVAMKKGSTLYDLAYKIHKDFVKKFKNARIWGRSVKYQGASVGLDHVLKEDDVIEIHIK